MPCHQPDGMSCEVDHSSMSDLLLLSFNRLQKWRTEDDVALTGRAWQQPQICSQPRRPATLHQKTTAHRACCPEAHRPPTTEPIDKRRWRCGPAPKRRCARRYQVSDSDPAYSRTCAGNAPNASCARPCGRPSPRGPFLPRPCRVPLPRPPPPPPPPPCLDSALGLVTFFPTPSSRAPMAPR